MPWKLIGFICVFIVFLIFIGFNLDNKCDINFGFKLLPGVPVFYTIFVSFALGFLCTLPVVFAARKKGSVPKNTKDKKDGENKDASVAQEFNEPAPDYTGGKYFKKKK